MKRWIVIASLVLFSLSCGKGIDTLPCEHGRYGVVDILNSTSSPNLIAYCRVDNLPEDAICKDPIFLEVHPGIRRSLRLRLLPGVYQFAIRYIGLGKPKEAGYEVTVQRCGNVNIHIEEHKVSLGDQPYHHTADKAKITERNSVIPEGLE